MPESTGNLCWRMYQAAGSEQWEPSPEDVPGSTRLRQLHLCSSSLSKEEGSGGKVQRRNACRCYHDGLRGSGVRGDTVRHSVTPAMTAIP
eukprot:1068086-Rhodomonas_salina.1